VRRSHGLALMVSAPLLWSTAGVVTRHVERASAFELVFWRSLFAFAFVATGFWSAVLLRFMAGVGFSGVHIVGMMLMVARLEGSTKARATPTSDEMEIGSQHDLGNVIGIWTRQDRDGFSSGINSA